MRRRSISGTEFMFGPAFLVAPVLEPGLTTAQVYAPPVAGGWYDWWSGTHVSNGGQISSAGTHRPHPVAGTAPEASSRWGPFSSMSTSSKIPRWRSESILGPMAA